MSYRYDKRKKTLKRWYFVSAFLLVIALFTPLYVWIFDTIEKPLVRSWENKTELIDGSENLFGIFYGKTRLVKKNKELEREIVRLEIDNLRTRYLSEKLEEVYQNIDTNNEIVIAEVLNHGVFGNLDTLIINQGAQNGITKGEKIIAHNSIALGYVSDVYDVTSRVELYSETNQSVEGILFPHNINLIANGQGNGSFLIETPREIEVVEGDILYSLEQPGNIIGIVRTVEFDPRDPFKQVYLSYPVNPSQVQTVGVKKTPRSTIVE